jgi:hypothetical protein
MNDSYATVVARLLASGFGETESGCFTSRTSPRVVGLAVSAAGPETWPKTADELLRKETMKITLSWARYVVLLVEGKKTTDLALSAAAFAQDVSRCRRMILFVEQGESRRATLPFMGLPSVEFGADTAPRDIETIVRKSLPPTLAEAFLDEDFPTAKVQLLAEEVE